MLRFRGDSGGRPKRPLGKDGQYGYGIHIGRGAEHVTIYGVTARKMWGDGFIVAGAKDVAFCSVIADRNRRQGLSVIEAAGHLSPLRTQRRSDPAYRGSAGTRGTQRGSRWKSAISASSLLRSSAEPNPRGIVRVDWASGSRDQD